MVFGEVHCNVRSRTLESLSSVKFGKWSRSLNECQLAIRVILLEVD